MIRKVLFGLVVFILCAPLPLSILKSIFPEIKMEINLDGAFVIPDLSDPSIKTILNGSFQNDFERWFNFKMVGRSTMTRIYNEILYRFFNSLNTIFNTWLMGKDKYLFGFPYPEAYLDEPDEDKKDELLDKLVMLALLQQKIEEMGKLLFVIITPSKASVYPEYLSNDFARYLSMKNAGRYSQNYYEYFASHAGETGLNYFDFHDDLIKLKNEGIDIFTKGGIHWTGPAVASYFSELINVLNKNTEKKIGTIQTVKAEPVWGNAFMTDDDIEEILNIIELPGKVKKILPFYKYLFPRAQFYSYHMESLSIPTDYRPSVFLCGGSFNYTWLLMVYGLGDWVTYGDNHIFSSVEFSFYNSFVMKYPEDIRISDTTDDFYSVLDKNIIIIEFNEQAMNPNIPQFVFVKNLLDFIEEKRN